MAKFKFGEVVIAKCDCDHPFFKKGDEVVIDGFSACCGCGAVCVYLKGVHALATNVHPGCFEGTPAGERIKWSEDLFEKPVSFGASVATEIEKSFSKEQEIKIPSYRPAPYKKTVS